MLILWVFKIVEVFAGQQALTPYIWLNWTYASETITFVLGIHSSLYGENKWAGVGLKAPDISQDMVSSDIVSFYLGSQQSCKDRHAVKNGLPPVDSVMNIKCFDRQKEGSYFLYEWSRNLTTGDTNDFNLQGQDRIMIIWAIGDMTSGDIAKHGNTGNDRGHQIVYLTGTSVSFASTIFLLITGIYFL